MSLYAMNQSGTSEFQKETVVICLLHVKFSDGSTSTRLIFIVFYIKRALRSYYEYTFVHEHAGENADMFNYSPDGNTSKQHSHVEPGLLSIRNKEESHKYAKVSAHIEYGL